MEITTQQQTYAFLWAFLLGAVIEVLYNVICAVRTVSPPTKLQLFIGDMIFMVTVSLLNTLYAISMTEGKIRLYTAAAEIAAYALLYFSVGRYAIRGLSVVIRFISGISERFVKHLQAAGTKMSGFIRETCRKKKYTEKN